jgi:shikimate kinase
MPNFLLKRSVRIIIIIIIGFGKSETAMNLHGKKKNNKKNNCSKVAQIMTTSDQVGQISLLQHNNICKDLKSKRLEIQAYNEQLEALLRAHNIPLPKKEEATNVINFENSEKSNSIGLLKDANEQEIKHLLEKVKKLYNNFTVTVTFRDLGFWKMVHEDKITTVGSTIKSWFCGSGPKHRVDILKGITGRLKPGCLTLLLGPPGSGKSVLLQAIAGRLRLGGAKLEGEILFNNTKESSGKFLCGKVADYIEQNDTHAATLTVEETVKYAWMSSSGGHHSYSTAADKESAAVLDQSDALFSRVNKTSFNNQLLFLTISSFC